MLNQKTKDEISQRVIDLFSNRYMSRKTRPDDLLRDRPNDLLREITIFVVDQCALYYKKKESKMKVRLTKEQQQRLDKNPCQENCKEIAKILTEYKDASFQEIVYIAKCDCQETRSCLKIDTAIDEWIKLNDY